MASGMIAQNSAECRSDRAPHDPTVRTTSNASTKRAPTVTVRGRRTPDLNMGSREPGCRHPLRVDRGAQNYSACPVRVPFCRVFVPAGEQLLRFATLLFAYLRGSHVPFRGSHRDEDNKGRLRPIL